ncbi:S8 family serine peptidase [Actinoplanes sp. N902-109]|uniref:S8 family serine peptidase n=1 Tax=Actinoplanes sp. (strain N902-109) TaxID=649831 RepID=UPI000329577A|nr:S8 family serine peptidase [Actinoplanes sp. N902-109]AGL18212.1 cell wall-associated (serine) protease [Actinoplanes sp. N902-109]
MLKIVLTTTLVLLTGTPAVASPADGAAVTTVARVVDASGRPTFVEVAARTVAEERRRAAALPGSTGYATEVPVRVAATPDDPDRPLQWSLDRLRGDDLPAVDVTGQLVAVVDTGVDAAHEDFAPGQVRCDLGTDLVDDTRDPDRDGCVDPQGHGTHVAGIAGAVSNNGTGVAGLASGVPILPVRAMDATGAGTSTAIADGIVYAVDHGATVINVSAAGDYSAVYDTAIGYATAHNVPVVVAAGNNGATGNQAQWPASAPGAVAVGAIQQNGTLAPYSNTSGAARITAPGTGIYGLDATTGGYVYKSGTSMAAPLVAASVALYEATHAGATTVQVTQALTGTAQAGVVNPYALVSAAVPAVTLSSLSVSKRARITVRVVAFEPGTTVTVTETYRYARKSVFIGKTVALGSARVSRAGTATRMVTPVQSAKSGTLTVRGTGADGSRIVITNRVTVG